MREIAQRTPPAASRQTGGRPDMVRIHLLGGFRVERDGQPVRESAWQRRSGKMLVKMLAAAAEHRLHREVLLDRLWPDADPAAAGKSFHQALLAVRRVLDAAGTQVRKESCLRLAGEMVVLVPECVSVDVDRFELLARRGLQSQEVEELTAAAEAYGGELLPEDRFEDWAEARREPLARLYVQVLLALADALERRGASFAAAERARQALEVDPTREDAHRFLMRFHAVSGHREEALRQYQVCRQALADELDVEPDEETEALHQDILSGSLEATASRELAVAVPLPSVPRRYSQSLFAGRDRPLGILHDKLSQLHAGNGSVLLISGEAGVGKTRLAVEAALVAGEAGALVLWGTSYAEEGQLPYGAFAEALDEYVGALPAGARERLNASYPELSRLLASVSAADASSTQAGGTRMQLFAAIGRLLFEIGSTRPLVLVLDDIHAADEVSVQLLHYLARLARQHPWLLIATYREEEVRPGDALHGVITACLRRGLADRIELLRLSRPEADTVARSLLEGEVDERLLQELFSLSLGNALFLQELIHAMRGAGQIAHVDGRWRATAGLSTLVPPGASELVITRASRLSADAGRIANLAAVAGMESSLDLLREAGALPESGLVECLEEIVASRIMETRDDAGSQEQRYAFRHPLFREALYAEISSPRRRLLHERIGRAMERVSPDDADALAYQWSRTANDEKAIRYLELAGDGATSRYAHEVAVTLYREAMNRLGEGDGPALARLEFRLGDVLARLGQYDDALILLDAARRYYQETADLEALARVVSSLAWAHRQRGTSDEGATIVRDLLARLGDGGGRRISIEASTNLHIALATTARGANRPEEAIREAEKAAALARAAGNDRALAIAENIRGSSLGSLGEMEEGVRVLEEARVLAEKVGDLFTVANALGNAGADYASLGNPARSMEYRARAAELYERLGYPAQQSFALSGLAFGLFSRGRWEEARRAVGRVLDIQESIDVSWYLKYALCTLGDIELGCGNGERARECFSQAHAMATAHSDTQILGWVAAGLAAAELLAGRPDAARTRLASYLAAEEMAGGAVLVTAHVLADALMELGELEEADGLLRTALAEAEAVKMKGHLFAELLRMRGKLLTRQGRRDEAETGLQEAIEEAREGDLPFIEGKAWLDLGLLHAARGERGRAADCLTRAEAIFQPLGTRLYLDRAQQALETVGDTLRA